MSKKVILIIFICALVFGFVRGMFLKNFLITNTSIKEVIISIIEITIVVILLKYVTNKK